MSIVSPPLDPAEVDYPESDGLPMSDNTRQFRWITTIQGGLDNLFRNDANVFVAGDLLWYPVQGNNKIRTAPDAMVVFGRPKGDRGSYLQWREAGIAPRVTFEVLSPSNRAADLAIKFDFYERYGVDEYYIWDPDNVVLRGWLRDGAVLRPIADMNGWVSPLLGIRFELMDDELHLYYPDGRPFGTYLDLAQTNEQVTRERDEAARERDAAARERDAAARERDEAARERDEERQRAEQLAREREALARQREEERQQAERLARERDELAQQREREREEAQRAAREREAERQRAERLAAQLRALGIDPDA
jgi:Uma2 family endonuclease